MSDIKYIIAGEDGDEANATRFGCLAMVRYVMAGIVTLLAITVVALVINAVLRSEDIGLSVSNGFIGADNLWSKTYSPGTSKRSSQVSVVVGGGNDPSSASSKVAELAAAGVAKLISRHRRMRAAPSSDETTIYGDGIQVNIGSSSRPALQKECFLGCSGGGVPESSQVTFDKANQTNLRVILIVSNPGGRTRVDCNGTTVSLFDMEAPERQIGNVSLGNLTVLPQTTITLQKRLKNTNTSYIWLNYRLETRFSVMVQVTSSVTSYPLGKKGKPKQHTYTCQPVTVGLIGDEAIYAGDHVDCITTISG